MRRNPILVAFLLIASPGTAFAVPATVTDLDAFDSFQTDVGFGTRFALGKQWWVGPHWAIGVSGWFAFSVNREGGGSDATWSTFLGGLGFTATRN